MDSDPTLAWPGPQAETGRFPGAGWPAWWQGLPPGQAEPRTANQRLLQARTLRARAGWAGAALAIPSFPRPSSASPSFARPALPRPSFGSPKLARTALQAVTVDPVARQWGFVLPVALLAGLVLASSSLMLLHLALVSHQGQVADQRRRQADDGLHDLGQLLAQVGIGHPPDQISAASLDQDQLAQTLPQGWQLAGLQWQASDPAEPSLVTLQVRLSGPGGALRQGLLHFERTLPDGPIAGLRQEGA